ncbi:hypothetical protein HPB47_013875 [Ixodes persulcatus]|uniref:Uncharacterized protein n=1 Tax=Ixodes persulcatus TaxID=34615 RepID=A0AC60QXQ7_IXOPE|nr:hypothetical protein HPB47_013875 [Ixodes persulcatus]
MGNSHSQAVQERPRATSLISANRKEQSNGYRAVKRLNKYASPGNRVLPQPVFDGVRLLRTTQNGNILQNGGTISGRRLVSKDSDAQDNPDLAKILQQRRSLSDAGDSDIEPGQLSRKAHSDPDLARSVMDDDDDDDEEEDDDGVTGRSVIAISPSKAKIKSRKKAKAPEPPQPQSSTLPRDLDRVPNGRSREEPKKAFSKFKGRRSESKSPAPTPPPPPPPPDYNSDDNGAFRSASSYEKNRRNVEKWKLSKGEQPNGKIEDPGNRRSTSSAEPPTRQGPLRLTKDLKEELLAVAKRRASNGHKAVEENGHENGRSAKTPPVCNGDAKSPKTQPKKQYYFSNFDALKLKDGLVQNGNAKKNQEKPSKADESVLSSRSLAAIDDHSQGESKVIEYILNDSSRMQNHIFPVELEPEPFHRGNRKAEDRQRNRSPVPAWPKAPWPLDNLSGGVSSSAKSSLSSGSDQDLNVNIQLRPTLPRKQMDIPRFSPTDAWRALWATDSPQLRRNERLRSEASTDDGDVLEEQIRRVSRVMAPRRVMADRCGDSGISPDAGSPLFIHDAIDNSAFGPGAGRRSEGVGRASPPDGVRDDHWVPKADLMDDSDSGSVDPTTSGLQEKHQPGMLGLQAKFTLPTNMFLPWSTPSTTLRTEDSSDLSSRPRGRLRKSPRLASTTENFNSLRNIRKVLGLRPRDAQEEIRGIDSNWSLSRSAPNSLNIVGELELRKTFEKSSEEAVTPEAEEKPIIAHWSESPKNDSARRTSSFTFSREGHVMYLPQYEVVHTSSSSNHKSSKSHASRYDHKKSKKFSYMSTVRKEERKRLEERLAQEVAEKERLREKEIRWMNRVEEEFRKQRDKEKLDIRQQLRILSLETKKTSRRDADPIFNGDEVNWNGNHKSAPNENGKWLKRRDSDGHMNGDHRNFSPPRPEPEGGRSSGDECRNSLENYNPAVAREPDRKKPVKKSIYDQLSRVLHQENLHKCNGKAESKGDRRSLSPASQAGNRSTRNRSSSPSRRRSSSYDDRRVDHPMSVFSKKESLQRTGSGRTYESHSNYIYSVPDKKKKDVPKEGRYRSLDDSDSMSDEICRGKQGARERNSSGDVVRRAHSKPLLTVQPFGASKGYRPVPFSLTQQHQPKPNR